MIVIGLLLITSAGILLWSNSSTTPGRMSAEQSPSAENVEQEPGTSGQYSIDPPVSSAGLQIFLIRGKDALDKHYTTLSTALKNDLVKVEETGTVGQLQIDNNSDEYVFIHSGDIVKGGKQDRTLAFDVIVPPKAKNVDIMSFCVEQGRWNARSGESVHEFEIAEKMLSSKELKLAAKYEKDQSKVWQKVHDIQDSLNLNMNRSYGVVSDVRKNASSSSLQLALENEELEKLKEELEGTFRHVLDTNSNALGCAYAINGEIMSVDIYNNKRLFEEIWEKLLDAMITETISLKVVENYEPATTADVSAFMAAVEDEGPDDKKKLNVATELHTAENDSGHVKFSTMDLAEKDWVHRNYMKK